MKRDYLSETQQVDFDTAFVGRAAASSAAGAALQLSQNSAVRQVCCDLVNRLAKPEYVSGSHTEVRRLRKAMRAAEMAAWEQADKVSAAAALRRTVIDARQPAKGETLVMAGLAVLAAGCIALGLLDSAQFVAGFEQWTQWVARVLG
jgi:hypothetical protein